jgi:hypothetical protein
MKMLISRAPEAHTYDPSYLGGWDQEDCSWRLAQANGFWDPPSPKINRAKWNGGVAHAVEHLLCKHEALGSNTCPIKKKMLIYPTYLEQFEA